MKTRIIVGALLAIMLLAVLYFGGFVLIVTLALFSFAATYEVSLVFKNKGFQPIVMPAYIFGLGFPFVYHFFGLLALIVFYIASVMATMVHSLFSKTHATADVFPSLALYVYPLMLLMCMLLTYFSFSRAIGLTAACMAFGAPECCDAFAYFGGSLFGKHKLCPRISPNKTTEGSIAALLGGAVFGLLIYGLQPFWSGSFPLWSLLLLGLCCGVFSQFGDLFASTLKRWAEIKDFSSVFPGHGGIMDRIDSILFCTPLVLLVVTILTRVGIY